jgi:hypothetical protein
MKMTIDQNLRRTCNSKTQMHAIKKPTPNVFLLVCGNNKNKTRRRLVFVEKVMNIIIFYKKEDEERHNLIANCEEGMEEVFVVVTSLVAFFYKFFRVLFCFILNISIRMSNNNK